MSAGLFVSFGLEGGYVFTAAHELLHSQSPIDRALCYSLLLTTGSLHWSRSHLAHHAKVFLL
jgi:alkane 1-monooxygenase